MDAIARRPKRVLPIDYGPRSRPALGGGQPLAESVWLEPYPDEALGIVDGHAAPDARYEQREAVELAFIASLQHLPATQRAVLILRDVLGFSAREVAESLETTVSSVNSALQRARKTVAERLPKRSQQETLRSIGDEPMRELVEAYLDAWTRADVDSLRELLAEDVVFSMPPWPVWWQGREEIAAFSKTAQHHCPETHRIPTRANAQLAVASYSLEPETGRHTASAIDVFTFEGSRLKEITAFVTPEVFPAFGLPTELAA